MSKKQIQSLKIGIVIQELFINDQNVKISLSIGLKRSQSGYFSNERLLLLNHTYSQLSYFTKIPQKYPFISEIQLLEAKKSINFEELSDVRKDDSKMNTLYINCKDKNNCWVFEMNSPQQAENWVQLINKAKLKEKQPSQKKQIKKIEVIKDKNINRFRDSAQISPKLMTFNEIISIINPLLPKKQQQYPWGQQWYLKSSQSKQQCRIYDQFVNMCKSIAKQLIDELLYRKMDRKHTPLRQDSNGHVFKIKGVLFHLNLWLDDAQLLYGQGENNILLYNHSTYSKIFQKFYNYELIFNVTRNKTQIKVPPVCQLHYKSIIVNCTATLPSNYNQISKGEQELNYIKKIQNKINVKINSYEYELYQKDNIDYLVMTDIGYIIPNIPTDFTKQHYFIKEQLLNQFTSQQLKPAGYKIYTQSNVHKFILQYQDSACSVLSSHDLANLMRRNLLTKADLAVINKHNMSFYLRKIIFSQITALIFIDIVRSQICSLLVNFPIDQFINQLPSTFDNIIIDCMCLLINGLIGYTAQSQHLWKIIVSEASKRFDLVICKSDLIAGYILNMVNNMIGLNINFKLIDFQANYFTQENVIPKQTFRFFRIISKQYTFEIFDQNLRQIPHLLQNNNDKAYEQVYAQLNLEKNAIPLELNYYYQEILTFCSNFIAYQNRVIYNHLPIYDKIYTKQPYNYNLFQIGLNALKWCLKKNQVKQSAQISRYLQRIMVFWSGYDNILLCQLYDVEILHYQSIGQYDEAIKFAEKSLQIYQKDYLIIKDRIGILEKYYFLGNLYLSSRRKKQALQMYLKTKAILQNCKRTEISLYAQLLIKIATLFLNLGQIRSSLILCRQALDYFSSDEQQRMNIYQLMGRSYQISLNIEELFALGKFCADYYNNIDNISIMKKMIKLFIFPRLCLMPIKQAKSLISILYILEKYKLEHLNQTDHSKQKSFQFLHKRAKYTSLMDNFANILGKIISILVQIEKNETQIIKNVEQCYNSQPKSEIQQSLAILQAIADIIGYEYLIGAVNQMI